MTDTTPNPDPVEPVGPDVPETPDAPDTPAGGPTHDADAGEIVPIADDDFATVERAILDMQTLAVEDSETIAVRLAAKKLRAGSIAELNAMGELGAVEDVLNIPVLVDDLHWNESRIADSRGAYAVFDATNSYTGERRTFGTGHMDVMITLFKASQWGLLPCRMVFTAAKNPNRFGKPTYLAEILPPEATPTE